MANITHRFSDPPPRDVHRPPHQRLASDPVLQKQAERVSPDKRRPTLEKNKLEVTLSFIGCEDWTGTALLDTGADTNCMSEHLRQSLGLPCQSHAKEYWKDVNGDLVTSDTIVRGSWHYHHRTYEVTFRLVPSTSFDVLFGCTLLEEVGLVDFEEHDKKHAGALLTLAKAGKQSASKSRLERQMESS